ncbi:MAG: hydantoinase [Solirubrobacterales bacterium]|nr:hydantoinase [Solirubrobacterales bacterium]
MTAGIRVAVDVGGTFTDLVAYDERQGRVHAEKVLTTPEDRSQGVADALERSGLELTEVEDFIHGTTVGTNAVLEGSTPPTALVTTRGFRDVLELMRGDRPMPVYDLSWRKPDPLIPRNLRFEVAERIDAQSRVVEPLDEDELRELLHDPRMDDVRAVAVCFMHSFVDDAHERQAAEIIAEERPDLQVSLSSVVNPEVREYERASTTALDAMLKPLMSSYLETLEQRLRERGLDAEILVMLANAGVMSRSGAGSRPIFTLHSGPAGGVVGATLIARELGRPNLIAADMGGTSFDVCAIVGGAPRFGSEGHVRWGIPFRIPVVDVGTIGAGGGSVGWVDDGGLLRVGPRSAGARPGPACYGLGGREATITDAACVLGYLKTGDLAGGEVQVQVGPAHDALARLAQRVEATPEDAADGMLRIAIANMAGEIRKNSVERGDDPRDFSLLTYGGAGSMFAGPLARSLGIREIIVPPNAGVFSAYGMLGADLRCDAQRTVYGRLEDVSLEALAVAFERAEGDVLAQFGRLRERVAITRRIALRYVGQRHELQVEMRPGGMTGASLQEARERFDLEHGRNYGHDRPGEPVEVRAISVTATAERPKPALRNTGRDRPVQALTGRRQLRLTSEPGLQDVPVYDRARLASGSGLAGPAVLESRDSTIVVHTGQTAAIHPTGAVLIQEAA